MALSLLMVNTVFSTSAVFSLKEDSVPRVYTSYYSDNRAAVGLAWDLERFSEAAHSVLLLFSL